MDYLPSTSRCLASISLSLLISWYGVRRKSLSLSGGVAAIAVGAILTAASGCFCCALLAFFLTSSRLTKWRSAEKKKLEHDHKEGGQRDWVQVLCNGGVATAAASYYIASAGYGERPFASSDSSSRATIATAACLASLACCCGDTWASEVGSVVGGTPYLVTSWGKVPRGTNGGVTLVGVLCSFLGGMVVGVAYFGALLLFVGCESFGDAISQSSVIVLGGLAGLWGSLLDSLLGATLQYSGYSEETRCVVHGPISGDVKHISGWDVLDNHAVNFVSSLLTAMTFALYYYYSLS